MVMQSIPALPIGPNVQAACLEIESVLLRAEGLFFLATGAMEEPEAKTHEPPVAAARGIQTIKQPPEFVHREPFFVGLLLLKVLDGGIGL